MNMILLQLSCSNTLSTTLIGRNSGCQTQKIHRTFSVLEEGKGWPNTHGYKKPYTYTQNSIAASVGWGGIYFQSLQSHFSVSMGLCVGFKPDTIFMWKLSAGIRLSGSILLIGTTGSSDILTVAITGIVLWSLQWSFTSPFTSVFSMCMSGMQKVYGAALFSGATALPFLCFSVSLVREEGSKIQYTHLAHMQSLGLQGFSPPFSDYYFFLQNGL